MTNELTLHDMQIQLNELKERMLKQEEQTCDYIAGQESLNTTILGVVHQLIRTKKNR